MTQNVLVPDIGDFESVEIIEVLVKSGDQINLDDPIVTLESDKSSVEVPSPFEGKISQLKVKIGDKVSRGSVLALIESNKEKFENKPVNKIETKKEEKVPPASEKIIKEAEILTKEKNLNGNRNKVYSRPNGSDIDPIETQEWLDSLEAVVKKDGTEIDIGSVLIRGCNVVIWECIDKVALNYNY